MDSSATWLEPDEAEVASWVAAVPTKGGRGAKYGGHLHLTTRRLVWLPLEVFVIYEVGFAGSVGGKAWAMALSDITRVEADPERKALLHVVSRSDERASLLVGAGARTPLWSKKNRVARDEAVERISAALPGCPSEGGA